MAVLACDLVGCSVVAVQKGCVAARPNLYPQSVMMYCQQWRLHWALLAVDQYFRLDPPTISALSLVAANPGLTSAANTRSTNSATINHSWYLRMSPMTAQKLQMGQNRRIHRLELLQGIPTLTKLAAAA